MVALASAPVRRPVLVAVGMIVASALTVGVSAPGAAPSSRRPDIGATAASPALGDLLTYHYDNARSGDDTVDAHIGVLSGRAAWHDSLDGAVYAEPLVYDGTVYVATENDTIYAIAVRSGEIRWRVHVGDPVSLSVVHQAPQTGCWDIDPLGITGTPVIDPATNELFAAEETDPGTNWQRIVDDVVAVSLTSHRLLWRRNVDPPRPNTPSTYYVAAQQERSALTLFNGEVYVPFGGTYGDCGAYHGYVDGVAESARGPVLSYQVPTQREGGIWGTSGALVSPQGDLFVTTGNGSSNNPADFDEGNAVIELSPTLQRLGVWAPSNWVELNNQDWDLGSAGPIQVPNSSLLFAAGKPAGDNSFGSLMSETHLGGVGRGAYTAAVCGGGGDYGADASDVVGPRIFIYVACSGGTVAVQVTPSTQRFSVVWTPSTGSPNGPPIVAGGLVWALDWNSGVLYGMAPATGRVVIERNTGPLNHFVTPAVGDHMLVVPTALGVEGFRTAT